MSFTEVTRPHSIYYADGNPRFFPLNRESLAQTEHTYGHGSTRDHLRHNGVILPYHRVVVTCCGVQRMPWVTWDSAIRQHACWRCLQCPGCIACNPTYCAQTPAVTWIPGGASMPLLLCQLSTPHLTNLKTFIERDRPYDAPVVRAIALEQRLRATLLNAT